MFAPLKKLVHTNAFYTAVLLLILLVMKNVLSPYVGYDQTAEFDWYDMLIIAVVVVSAAASGVSAYKYSLKTAESLYAATKTGFYSALYTTLTVTIVSLALPMLISQSYNNQLADSFNTSSRLATLVVFNLVGIMMLSALGAFAGFIGGLAGWVLGVLSVHGIIQRDIAAEPTDDALVQQAVQEPTTYSYETIPSVDETPTPLAPDPQLPPVPEIIDTPAPEAPQAPNTYEAVVPQPEAVVEQMAAPQTIDTPTPTSHATPLPAAQAEVAHHLTPLHFIHFIPEHDLQTLYSVGVLHVEDILDRGGSRPKREVLSAQTGIDPTILLTYANVADLMRLPGIDSAFAQLLEKAGVDSVVEMAKRNPQNLHDALVNTNQAEAITHTIPTIDQLKGMINAAKMLGREIGQ